MPKRVLQGTVISRPGDKTVKVKVERRLSHKLYKKIIRKSKNYAAHDEENRFNVGDTVRIRESRPYSKSKQWEAIYEDNAAK